MQQKRTLSSGGMSPVARLVIGLALLLIGGVAWLALSDIPAPSQPVEQKLDAKTFLTPQN
jgi:hypothetical protein